MTNEQKRIAIAEFCGFKWFRYKGYTYHFQFLLKPHNNWWLEEIPDDLSKMTSGNPLECVPDYLSDLNAMHEAENHLPKNLEYTYAHNVYNVVVPLGVQPFRATASQRADALLMTIGKI